MSNDQETRLDSLTGLRFVAAMAVFVCHLLLVFPLLGARDQMSHITAPLGLGGVGFFYVLSGFILTYVYATRSKTLSIREFYIKRIARVWPLHLATFVIVLFGIVTLSHQLGQENGLAQIVANIFLLQTWWPDYDWVFSINGPSWSLSNEAFFYFVFPWLLAGGAAAFRKKLIAYVVAVIALLITLALLPSSFFDEAVAACVLRANPLLRLFDFMIGMGCGFIFVSYQKRAANVEHVDVEHANVEHASVERVDNQSSSFGGALFQMFAMSSCMAYFMAINLWIDDWDQMVVGTHHVFVTWLAFSGAAPLFALTIFAFARRSSSISKVLASPIMVYLGEASFAFYLIHQPILTWLSRQVVAGSPFASWWIAAAALTLSLAAAMLLHHLIELPSRAGLIRIFSGNDSKEGWVRRWGALFTEYALATWRLVCHPRIAVVTILTIAGFVFLDEGRFDHRDTALINQVVNQTPAEFKDVQFDQDAVLRGLEIDHQPDGSCRIQMVWDLKKERRPIRFLHICDSNGKILRHANGNQPIFAQVTGNEVVLDRVTIPAEQLDSASMLAIGFYGPKRKSAPIINPTPGQPTHRLPILRFDRLSSTEPVDSAKELR